MKIVYLTAGAADMYCGTCLHDNTLAAALLDAGHDVLLTPLYTPTRTDEKNVSGSHVFFSGINVFLQQKSWLFRHTPRFIDRWFESPWLLHKLSGRASATAPEKLGNLTVSMLRGEEGRQRKEVTKLVDWLSQEKPGVVHFSNSLLLGAAREIRSKLAIPIVCSLSGEDSFLEHITEPHYSLAREALRERSRDVDRFVAMNTYYADFMAEYLGVARDRIEVIPHGLNVEHYQPVDSREDRSTITFGFLARITRDKGLHTLVEAAKLLAKRRDASAFRVRAAGYLGQLDRPYLTEIERSAAEAPAIDFEYIGELDLAAKLRFLSNLDAMALPTVYQESKGLPALESLAVGTPIIVPEHGVFPEFVADTRGGVLHEPENPHSLAERFVEHLDHPEQAAARGKLGQAAVLDRYTADRMATETLELYVRAKSASSCSS